MWTDVFLEGYLKSFSGFLFLAVEPTRKDGNDGKLQIWLNPKLFYCSIAVCFLKLMIMFFLLERASLGWPYTFCRRFCRFQRFRRIDLDHS